MSVLLGLHSLQKSHGGKGTINKSALGADSFLCALRPGSHHTSSASPPPEDGACQADETGCNFLGFVALRRNLRFQSYRRQPGFSIHFNNPEC